MTKGQRRPRWGLRALALIAILAACYGLAVLVARPRVADPATNPYAGKRGASRAKSAGLAIHVRRGDEVLPVDPQMVLRSGDVLTFKVLGEGAVYVEVRFRDGASPPLTVFPAPGAAMTPEVYPRQWLRSTPPLGPGAGKVVVTAIFSDRPRPVGTPVDGDSRAITALINKE